MCNSSSALALSLPPLPVSLPPLKSIAVSDAYKDISLTLLTVLNTFLGSNACSYTKNLQKCADWGSMLTNNREGCPSKSKKEKLKYNIAEYCHHFTNLGVLTALKTSGACKVKDFKFDELYRLCNHTFCVCAYLFELGLAVETRQLDDSKYSFGLDTNGIQKPWHSIIAQYELPSFSQADQIQSEKQEVHAKINQTIRLLQEKLVAHNVLTGVGR